MSKEVRRSTACRMAYFAEIAADNMHEEGNEHGAGKAEEVAAFWTERIDVKFETAEEMTYDEFSAALKLLDLSIRLYLEKEGIRGFNSVFVRNENEKPFDGYDAELKIGWASDGAETDARAFAKVLAFAADLLDASELNGVHVNGLKLKG